MGDRSVEVTEDMRDKAQEERQQGSMAMAEGNRHRFIPSYSLLCTELPGGNVEVVVGLKEAVWLGGGCGVWCGVAGTHGQCKEGWCK